MNYYSRKPTKPTNQPTHQPTNDQPTTTNQQPTTTNQLTNQPTTNQPTNQPTNQRLTNTTNHTTTHQRTNYYTNSTNSPTTTPHQRLHHHLHQRHQLTNPTNQPTHNHQRTNSPTHQHATNHQRHHYYSTRTNHTYYTPPLPVASTSFVLSFAAWTSGWSNGLISRIEPATAIANSQRKNSLPSVVRVGRLGRAALAVGAVRRLAGRRDEALALLAGRLRDQLLGPEAEAAVGLGDADLVAALLPACAELAAELVARDCRRRERQASRHLLRRARAGASTSTPISAAGTIPNGDSAE